MSHSRLPTEASAAAGASSSTLLPNLPAELRRHIFSYLTTKENVRSRSTCKTFRDNMPCWRPQRLEDSKAIPESLPKYFSVDFSLITTPERGRAHLADWLRALRERGDVQHLILPTNITRNEGKLLCDALQGMHTLETLKIGRSDLMHEDVDGLIHALGGAHSQLRWLTLSGSLNLGGYVSALSLLPSLRALDLSYSPHVGGNFLTTLPSSLRELDLKGCGSALSRTDFFKLAIGAFQRERPHVRVQGPDVTPSSGRQEHREDGAGSLGRREHREDGAGPAASRRRTDSPAGRQ